ncbi:MAG: glycosyltransferase family 39 protein [Chloroflexi bacterium]|nr:glycosyltransferase family 39 protein [Chloroflexota bacterium]
MRDLLRKFRPNPANRFAASVLLVVVVATGYKIMLLAADVFPFNSDEAVVGLMARHILAGKWQVFFYGQAYMGSLDATFVALGFSLFGSQTVIIRVVQIILWSATIITTALLGRMIFNSERIGLIAAIFLAIPTVNTTLYTSISLGGYGEALLIGNLLLISAIKARKSGELKWYGLWGFLAGLGLWAFGITLVFIVPTAILLVITLSKIQSGPQRWRPVVASMLAAGVGGSPLLVWAFQNNVSPLFEELFGSAITGASSTNLIIFLFEHIRNIVLLGSTVIFGLRPPWAVVWLAQPLLSFAFAFWVFVIGYAFLQLKRKDEAMEGRWLLMGASGSLFLGFIFTPFGADPSGRYFLPFVVPMALFAAETIELIRQKASSVVWSRVILGLILVFNFWGTVEAASTRPPGITTQFDSITWLDHSYDSELVKFLTEKGEFRGYSNYWVAYPLAFQSNESLLFVPTLPYHQDFRYTPRDNRYLPYYEQVESSDRIAYISTNHAALNELLREKFSEAEVSWEETQIGNYVIFYNLSEPFRPVGMGELNWAAED